MKLLLFYLDMANDSKIEQRWGKEVIEGIGFTAIPSIILERQEALGLEPVDLNLILQLIFHWRERDRLPYPSKATLARRLGVSARTVQRRIAALEAAGFVDRRERKNRHGGNDSNEYSLEGLIEKTKPFAAERRALKQKHEEEDQQRLHRKRAATSGGNS
jgi:DNA-binding transcriptional regulator YhcF (GntR family)